MGKKDKKKQNPSSGGVSSVSPSNPKNILSKRGWKMVGAGICTVALGFLVLSFTDPRGQNFASTLCPFLIIGGYALIGFGIVTKDSVPPSHP